MNNDPPRISVILPVYNGQDYLAQAIDSVLSQSFSDFELIIINDGSTDGSVAIIEKLTDPRIRLFQQSNMGLAATLNRAISLAKGKYIARQDQDDVCFQSRFEEQINFLDANPDVGMVGTCAEIWVDNERTNRYLRHPVDDASLKFGLLFDNHFVHSSVMIRRSVFEKVGGYSEDKSRQPPEDYELWSRVMKSYKLANLPEVLMAYREVEGSMSRTGISPFVPNLVRITAENISWATGRGMDAAEVVALSRLAHGVYEGISPNVRFRQLNEVLYYAVSQIAIVSGVPVQQLNAALRVRSNLLRYQYLEYRSGGLLGRITKSQFGKNAKNLAKWLLKVSHL
jgi:glycosyltransferase involved in cell wall biosynthesis